MSRCVACGFSLSSRRQRCTKGRTCQPAARCFPRPDSHVILMKCRKAVTLHQMSTSQEYEERLLSLWTTKPGRIFGLLVFPRCIICFHRLPRLLTYRKTFFRLFRVLKFTRDIPPSRPFQSIIPAHDRRKMWLEISGADLLIRKNRTVYVCSRFGAA